MESKHPYPTFCSGPQGADCRWFQPCDQVRSGWEDTLTAPRGWGGPGYPDATVLLGPAVTGQRVFRTHKTGEGEQRQLGGVAILGR
jgi:hypothetical protein